jgi:hypothetical protein
LNDPIGSYRLHGTVIRIAGDASLVAVVDRRLRSFSIDDMAPPDLEFRFQCVSPGDRHVIEQPVGTARTVYESTLGKVLYVDATDQLYVDCAGRVTMRCDVARGRVLICVTTCVVESVWLASHPLFTISLLELLKRRGCYGVHAAGVCVDGAGILLPGTSGAGKSTLAVALVRAGFGFLGDDTLFLSRGPQGMRVLAFPDEIDLADDIVRFFPELRDLIDQPKSPIRNKGQISAERTRAGSIVRECRPAAVVFPRITQSAHSTLEPMADDEALLELAPNVLLTEAASAQSNLDALAELVRVTNCYRLNTGLDVAAVDRLLRPVVRGD